MDKGGQKAPNRAVWEDHCSKWGSLGGRSNHHLWKEAVMLPRTVSMKFLSKVAG